MEITIKTDKDIQSLSIVFADNTNSQIKINEPIRESKPITNGLDNLNKSSTIERRIDDTEPFVLPSTDGREAKVDEDFGKKTF